MKQISLNTDWEFYESDESMSFVFQRPEAVTVNLPHDFIITKPRSPQAAGGPGNGYFGQGEGVYRKELEAAKSWEGKTVLLDIDGAYMNSEISVNEELLALHPYGYTPFQVDISSALRFDGRKNILKIITQSRQPSSRWYSGGGLYRSVSLWLGERICISPWDVFVTTPEVTEDSAVAEFAVSLTSCEEEERELTLVCEVLDPEGKAAGTASRQVKTSRSGEEAPCRIPVTVEKPRRWEPDTPVLYTYRVLVKEGEKIWDTAEDTFGIRTISVDPENGFRLNGRTVKLKGGCLHHDNGLLGACAYAKAEERKIRLLQSAGYNAVRISHYPPSLAMLKICDRLGMLLLDECFDVWRLGKVPMDYHLYFEDWWERDMEWMVKRDRNHPCVISYSIGNEIGERDGRNDGAAWSARLSEKIRSLDPTRFVLSAICGIFGEDTEVGTNFEANILEDKEDGWKEKTKDYAAPLDIVGYNYLNVRYEKDHEAFPDRVICATETHACSTYDYWEGVKKYPWVIGDFIWAAVDYLGEVGVGQVYWKKENKPFQFMAAYPWRTSWQSDFLMTGERRPQSFYRELMWGHTDKTWLFTTHPSHYGDEFYGSGWHWPDVNDDWSFGSEWEGRMVSAVSYGPGEEAEFILNGTSLGRVPYERLTAKMDISYTPGILEAVSYREGKEISRGSLVTAGEAVRILAEPEQDTLKGDGQDICYIRIMIADENGVRLPAEEREIQAELTGPAVPAALGSGNPCTEDQIGQMSCHTFHGTAQLIIKVSEAGKIGIAVRSGGLQTGYAAVHAV